MLRRLRRPAALAAPLLLLTSLAAGCGESTTVESEASDRLDAVEIAGEVGSSPEVTWKNQMRADDAESEVITEGDGVAVDDGGTVFVNYWVGNGFTEDTVLDTYKGGDGEGEGAGAVPITVGGEVPAPQTQNPTEAEIARYLLDSFVGSQVEPGDTAGTRKAVTVNASEVVGFGGGGLNIGNLDALLVVIDLTSVPLSAPEGTQVKRPPFAPSIVLKKKLPGSLDFSSTPEPTGELRVGTLVKGEGEAVESGDTIVVNYLGQVYNGKEPFDESYSRGTPLTTVIGAGSVIDGWDQGLVGVPVGSRVLLVIPPDLGYGAEGNPGAGIKGTDTLYFVIDVLGAA
ncbi:MAG: FKBP-type peptidyl-prolyl cis-trans isomerase [Nocardioides sp.]